jgi:murein DD-endopeptidase MepM/ murein hydrolase activator NlpD
MSRSSLKVAPRAVATCLFGASLLVFGGVAFSWHPAADQLDLAAAASLLYSPPADVDPHAPLVEQIAGADDSAAAPEAPPATPQWEAYTVKKGDTLGRILPRFGMPTHAVHRAALGHHDLAKLQAGTSFEFLMAPGQSAALALRTKLNADRTLVVERVDEVSEDDGSTAVSWNASVDEIVYETRVGLREFTVESTLWGAAIGAGLRPADIVGLADVYRFDLDFNTEIRAGATARMVVEELWLNDTFVRLGPPLAVRLENSDKEYVAIRFQDGERDAGYYDNEGQARKKPFLRSPLRFSRVTSGFNRNRYHPVLKKRRPHNGVDFGATRGTPVYAVGAGKVTTAKVNGGHGRFVKIDHAGPYDSSYSHLSRLAVRSGQRVKQGQIIGYVGSTGLATGPHLHYQFWVGGKYVNPLTVKLPNDGAEDVRDRKGFATWRDGLLAQLDAAVPVDDVGIAVADARE